MTGYVIARSSVEPGGTYGTTLLAVWSLSRRTMIGYTLVLSTTRESGPAALHAATVDAREMPVFVHHARGIEQDAAATRPSIWAPSSRACVARVDISGCTPTTDRICVTIGVTGAHAGRIAGRIRRYHDGDRTVLIPRAKLRGSQLDFAFQ